MANENIIKYLRENKEKYSVEVLMGKLRSAGYPEDQIQEGIRLMYGGEAKSDLAELPGASFLSAKTSFWDFRSVRVYRSGGEKVVDALFGFFVVGIFAPWLIFLILRSFVGFPIILLFDIGSIIYLWRRRRFMAFGILFLFASTVFLLFLGGFRVFWPTTRFYNFW